MKKSAWKLQSTCRNTRTKSVLLGSVLHTTHDHGVVIVLVVMVMCSCRTTRSVPTITQQSQISNQQLRIDSVYHYEKDSMSVTLRAGSLCDLPWLSGAQAGSDPTCYPARVDTLVVERWHTRWKDHDRVRIDTVYQTQTLTQTETVTTNDVPRFYKWCTGLFWTLLALVLGHFVYRLVKTVYLRK